MEENCSPQNRLRTLVKPSMGLLDASQSYSSDDEADLEFHRGSGGAPARSALVIMNDSNMDDDDDDDDDDESLDESTPRPRPRLSNCMNSVERAHRMLSISTRLDSPTPSSSRATGESVLLDDLESFDLAAADRSSVLDSSLLPSSSSKFSSNADSSQAHKTPQPPVAVSSSHKMGHAQRRSSCDGEGEEEANEISTLGDPFLLDELSVVGGTTSELPRPVTAAGEIDSAVSQVDTSVQLSPATRQLFELSVVEASPDEVRKNGVSQSDAAHPRPQRRMSMAQKAERMEAAVRRSMGGGGALLASQQGGGGEREAAALRREAAEWRQKYESELANNREIAGLLAQFESTIPRLMEEEKARLDAERKQRLAVEKENAELVGAFNDLKARYTEYKGVVENARANEQTLRESLASLDKDAKRWEQKYRMLRTQAEQKLTQASQQVKTLQRELAEQDSQCTAVLQEKIAELTTVQHLFEQEKIRSQSLADDLDAKCRANEELITICDQLHALLAQ